MWKTFARTILDFLWPKRCINCAILGKHLCDDCFALIEIFRETYCPFCQWPQNTRPGPTCAYHKRYKNLDGLFFAASYNDPLIKRTVNLYKYSYIKGLSDVLAYLIIAHFQLSNKQVNFADCIFCAVPLHKTKLKYRGFNQAQEIARRLSDFSQAPFIADVLIKIKKVPSQTELNREQREKNVFGTFAFNPQKKGFIAGKKILLVDDVFTTGATLEECAKILKQNNAKEVWGVAVARD